MIAAVVVSYKLNPDLLAAFRARNKDYRIIAVGDLPECNCEYPGEDDGIFSIGRAANIGIRYATKAGHTAIIKTDIDCILPEPAEASQHIRHGQGAAFHYWQVADGSAEAKAAAEFDGRCIGTCAMMAADWELSGGYYEAMKGYGYDDFAVIDRARKRGIIIPILKRPKVYHVRHEPHNRATCNPVMRRYNMQAQHD
jgi:hypothetical protein